MAICKQLTELMGGSITLRSELGAGSTFVVTLPLAPEDGHLPTAAAPHVGLLG